MNAPAIITSAEARALVETVERARALLDDGDVMQAKLFAALAYDQAKIAAKFAEAAQHGEQLIAKAHRLQGDALLIESRAKVVLADAYDAAQATGQASKGGRPKTVPDENGFTAQEAGLSRQEIHAARKLRDAERREPGIVQRAIDARVAAGLEPSRANLRHAIGTRSATKEERGDNFYETPIEAMRTLLALESFLPLVVDPSCGKGASSRPLEDAGHDVALADLVDRGCHDRHGVVQRVGDFLAAAPSDLGIGEGQDFDIVTNPPYGPALNGFVAHALSVWRPRKLALLLNVNFCCGTEDAGRAFALTENRPAREWVFARRLPMMHRDGWEGDRSTSQMNTSWYVWERQGDRATGGYVGAWQKRRVDWQNFETTPALPVEVPGSGMSGGLMPFTAQPSGSPLAARGSDKSAASNPEAKASEDNGRTSATDGAPMAGEASRPDVGRSASATSERMDETAGETAPHSNSPPTSSRAADMAGAAPPPAAPAAAKSRRRFKHLDGAVR